MNGARNIVVIWFSVVPANANSSRNNLSVVLPFLNQGCCFKLIVALIAHGLYDHAISFHVIYNSDLWSVNFITVAVCQVLLFDPRSGNGYELHIYRWRLSCIITHIQKKLYEVSSSLLTEFCECAGRLADLFQEYQISVTSSIRVSRVGGWTSV